MEAASARMNPAHREAPLATANGFVALAVGLVLVVIALALFWRALAQGELHFSLSLIVAGVLVGTLAGLTLAGLYTLQPNEAALMLLFGAYRGTSRVSGLRATNPFYTRRKISLRARNLNGDKLKVNDHRGNPIEIAAVVVWHVEDTAKAAFDVDDYENFVKVQSEAAVRHLASSFAYDRGDGDDPADAAAPTLLASADVVTGALVSELGARQKIVRGAVTMVEMALADLSAREVVALDDERKAAMVSNLMTVLCSESDVQPVVNTRTLYH